jgi:hypothetical protein
LLRHLLRDCSSSAWAMLAAPQYQARRRFHWLLRLLGVAGLIDIVAVPVLAVNISKADQRSPRIDKAISISVRFVDRPTALAGAACDVTKPFTGLAVGGTFERPLIRLPAQNGCEGVSMTLRTNDSYVVATP